MSRLEAEIGARLEEGDHAGAATCALRGYGPEILGYLASILRDAPAADEVFSTFCEDLWRGVPQFRRASSFRTWAYKIAWHAAVRHLEDPFKKRGQPLATEQAEKLAVEVRTTTALHLRDTAKDALAALRAGLAPEEQALLVLRVDRGLSWTEIAEALADAGAPAAGEAALRKRFERLKGKLRQEAEALGLLPPPK